jgi:taurine dioxygenase
MLMFRDQKITREQHLAFSRRFGEPTAATRHCRAERHPDHSELLLVTNIPEKDGTESASNTGQQWHADMSFTLSRRSAPCCTEL